MSERPLCFSANFYAAGSSTTRQVEVLFESGVLVISGPDETLRVPLQELQCSPRVANTTRCLRLADGASLETPDNDVIDLILFRGQKRRSLLHLLESRLPYVLFALAFSAAMVTALVVWGVPLGARIAAFAAPATMTQDLGKGTLEALDYTLFSESELEATERQALLGRFTLMAEQHPELKLSLRFRKLGVPNAFALPDGTLVVSDALVRLANKPQQVLAVLAHEIGHIQHRHMLRMALESASIALLASSYLGDISQLTLLSGALPAAYSNSHYSRVHETEADEFALENIQARYRALLGVQPQDFADILEMMTDALSSGRKGDPPPYLSSHPATDTRIKRFREAASF